VRFIYNLTVPKDTAKQVPEVSRVKVTRGTIQRVMVRFLRGPHNQVYVKLVHGLHQILPISGSEAINGDGQIWDVPMNYPLTDPSPELTLVGWSPDTRYQHVITFFIDIEPIEKDERTAILEYIFGKGRAV
jgi:hypothetical protein